MDTANLNRDEKSELLHSIINSLEILEEEKDLYYFSMNILDDRNFELFFRKIIWEFSPKIVSSSFTSL